MEQAVEEKALEKTETLVQALNVPGIKVKTRNQTTFTET